MSTVPVRVEPGPGWPVPVEREPATDASPAGGIASLKRAGRDWPAHQLPADTTRLVRLPGARHTIFCDRPDLAFPAVKNFVSRLSRSQPAS